MKIYFTASERQKTEYEPIYEKIIIFLRKNKYEVYEKILAQHLPSLSQISSNKIKDWYKEWSEYISQCDLAIVEGSYPSSIEIGFEIAMILMRGKPVVLLHKDDKNPAFVNNLYSPRLIKSEYTDNNLNEVLEWCLDEVKLLSNKRFTFYITSDIDDYLNKICSTKNTTKSEYIRDLIMRNINNEEH